MKYLSFLLIVSTFGIYLLTVLAIYGYGFNWPAVAINDLLSINWRSQFNFDFVVHLLLLASWVVWREGASKRGYLFGFLSIVMGGMFSFPYIVYAAVNANFDVRILLMGKRAAN